MNVILTVKDCKIGP